MDRRDEVIIFLDKLVNMVNKNVDGKLKYDGYEIYVGEMVIKLLKDRAEKDIFDMGFIVFSKADIPILEDVIKDLKVLRELEK